VDSTPHVKPWNEITGGRIADGLALRFSDRLTIPMAAAYMPRQGM